MGVRDFDLRPYGQLGGRQVYKDKGFTLVEILVVLAVLALLIPVSLLVVSHTLNANNEARLRSGATLLAEGIVEQLLSSDSPPPEGEQPPYRWRWQAHSGAGVPAGLEGIEVQVTWELRGRPHHVQILTYRQGRHE